MICSLCGGSKTLACMQASFDGREDPKTGKWIPDRLVREFYDCPACAGMGVRSLLGPATIRIHRLIQRKPRKS